MTGPQADPAELDSAPEPEVPSRSGTPRPVSAWLPLLASLLPVAAAIAFHLAGPRPQASAAGTSRPPLAFHHYSVNLGQVEPRRNHTAVFVFTNRGDTSVELRRLETSCGCLSDHTDKRVFGPGEEGEFYLRIQSASQSPGPKDYTCKAIYGPVGSPGVEYSEDLKFHINLPEQSVVLNPRALILHQPNGNPTTHTVEVKDLRDRPLTVQSATFDPPLADVRIVPSTDLTAAELNEGVRAHIQVTFGAVPPGRHECVIRIQTSDREFDVLKVPVRIHGPEQASQPIGPVLPNRPADGA